MPNSHDTTQEYTTGFRELSTAFVGISHGITRPKSVQRKLEDAARGRLRNPLGSYPVVAEECAKAGGGWFYVTRPLFVQLARLRKIFGNRSVCSLEEALMIAKKEEAEAGCAELSLALSVNGPEHSVLASYIRETREEIEAETRAVEIAEEMLYARAR